MSSCLVLARDFAGGGKSRLDSKGSTLFPSGKWLGYWDQQGVGRQEMHDLTLTFESGRVEGAGWDCVGKFRLEGEIDPTREVPVYLVKRYLDRHIVVYVGQHDGEGTIFGSWTLELDRGSFALRPDLRGMDHSSLPIADWPQ